MALVRWNPWQEIDTLERQISRLFDEVSAPTTRQENRVSIRTPAAEIKETPDAIHLKIEIPGMEAKDLDVQVTESAVSVSGERKAKPQTEENGVTRSEFRYGRFQRVIGLPARIQNTNVTAEYKDGILNLNLPKLAAETNKIVKVNLEQAAA